jgi:hypothetical protein
MRCPCPQINSSHKPKYNLRIKGIETDALGDGIHKYWSTNKLHQNSPANIHEVYRSGSKPTSSYPCVHAIKSRQTKDRSW